MCDKNCLTLQCNEAPRKEAEPRVEFKPLYFSSPFHEWKYVSVRVCYCVCFYSFTYFLAVYMDAFWKEM